MTADPPVSPEVDQPGQQGIDIDVEPAPTENPDVSADDEDGPALGNTLIDPAAS